ncbi:HAD-IIB family hydrolase [Paenibacillus protaetiae]|uniref:HAD-IIB family hydrolase n=1 Tax=Paenibacillus protaetiae TaxID=2509456 RepID=A0A4P6EVW6_9BACL|nr:HAD-IIB family hydrolase [Paenibacillus protaetiae]QAY65839.1 HAD-IIB family hydrolase [Paenibacillus protaetiae]
MKFVFDLDGTICFQGKPLSEPVTDILDKLREDGHEVIFASARPIRDLLPVLPVHMHQAPMVGGNGGFVYKDGRHIASHRLEAAAADRIIHLIKQYEADYLVDSLWNYAYSGNSEHPIRKNLDPENRAKNVCIDDLEEIVKVVILNSLDQQRLMSELEKLPVKMYKHGSEEIIDISPEGVNKWSGLQLLGLQPGEYIAFGNDANDIPMFQQAARSICVGNHAELMEYASEHVESEESKIIQKLNEMIAEFRNEIKEGSLNRT